MVRGLSMNIRHLHLANPHMEPADIYHLNFIVADSHRRVNPEFDFPPLSAVRSLLLLSSLLRRRAFGCQLGWLVVPQPATYLLLPPRWV